MFVYSIAATMSSNGLGIVKNISSPRDMLLVVFFGFGVGFGFVLALPLLLFLVGTLLPGFGVLAEIDKFRKVAIILASIFVQPIIRLRWCLYA